MNKARREDIQKAVSLLEEANSILEQVREEEQEAYDNMPESFQHGERGNKAQGVIGDLESAISELESAKADAESAAEE